MIAQLMFISLVKVPWDSVRYADRIGPKMTGRNHRAEAELSRRFAPLSTTKPTIVQTPVTLVDVHGVILGWYLPNIISVRRQVFAQ